MNSFSVIRNVRRGKRPFHLLYALILGLGLVLALLLALTAVTEPVYAGTLCVKPGGGDGCEQAIQDALDMAQPGDTILVAAGTYTENVVVTQTVTLQGGWNLDFTVRDLDQFTTTIKPADNTLSVARIHGQSGNTGAVAPTLDGFLITGGRADLGGNHGGGLSISNSNARVISNTVIDNAAFLFGGGIWVQGGAPSIEDNHIEGNSSFGNGQEAYGGGVQLENTQATLVGNLITHNVVSGTQAYGGGIDIFGGGLVALSDNAVISNTAGLVATEGFGGGISTRDVDLILDGDVISGNLALEDGGGLYVSRALSVTQAIIAGNSVPHDGGGIYSNSPGGNLWISKTVLAANEAGVDGGGIYFVPLVLGQSQAIQGNANEDYGRLWVHSSHFSGNSAGSSGGGILKRAGLSSITNSTLSGNQAGSGGAIEVGYGRLTISNTLMTANQAGDGGALYASTDQVILIHTSVISDNTALCNAGAFLNTQSARLTITHSTIAGNVASDAAGAIENQGWLNVTSSLIRANSAGDDGGAILNSNNATASLVNTDVVENTADNDNNATGDGGGMYNTGRASLQATTVSSNSAATFGGGIFSNGTLTITASLLNGNSADDGGVLFVEDAASLTTILSSTLDHNIARQSAGAINNSGMLAVTASTFSGNTAEQASAGAILNNGETTLINVTLSGNTAGGFGGALRNLDTLTMTGVTISDNEALTGAGIYNDQDTWLVNTILADNTGANCGGNPLTSLGHNLEDSDSCNLDLVLDDLIDTDPLLGPLADNGGDTQTYALLTGSPAIDAGHNAAAACPPTDQRGVPRPIDGDGDGDADCDIGAFEVQLATTTAILSDAPDPSAPGEPFTVTVSVASTLGTPAGAVTVTASGDPQSCNTILVGGMGNCALALSVTGSYTLTAAYGGDGTYAPSSATEAHAVETISNGLYLPLVMR